MGWVGVKKGWRGSSFFFYYHVCEFFFLFLARCVCFLFVGLTLIYIIYNFWIGYLLSVFSYVCWTVPKNVPVNQLFGVRTGMGMVFWCLIGRRLVGLGVRWWVSFLSSRFFSFESLDAKSWYYFLVPWWAEVHISPTSPSPQMFPTNGSHQVHLPSPSLRHNGRRIHPNASLLLATMLPDFMDALRQHPGDHCWIISYPTCYRHQLQFTTQPANTIITTPHTSITILTRWNANTYTSTRMRQNATQRQQPCTCFTSSETWSSNFFYKCSRFRNMNTIPLNYNIL